MKINKKQFILIWFLAAIALFRIVLLIITEHQWRYQIRQGEIYTILGLEILFLVIAGPILFFSFSDSIWQKFKKMFWQIMIGIGLLTFVSVGVYVTIEIKKVKHEEGTGTFQPDRLLELTSAEKALKTVKIELLEKPTISSSNSIDVKIAFTNVSNKNIRAVKFCMVIENIFGKNFTSSRDIEYVGTIKPSETVTVLQNFELWDDEGVALKKLTSLEFKDIVLKTYPIQFKIIFEDGTKIEA